MEVIWNGRGPLPGQEIDGQYYWRTKGNLTDYAPRSSEFITQREARANTKVIEPKKPTGVVYRCVCGRVRPKDRERCRKCIASGLGRRRRRAAGAVPRP